MGSIVLTMGAALAARAGQVDLWWGAAFFAACSVIIGFDLVPQSWFTKLPEGSFLRRLSERYRRQIPNPSQGELTADENGFTHSRKDGETSFEWDRVLRINAFKRDLLTTDCICICVELEDGNCVINEDMIGFMAVVESMQKRFAISPDWIFEIAAPAFETNLRLLYEAGEAAGAKSTP